MNEQSARCGVMCYHAVCTLSLGHDGKHSSHRGHYQWDDEYQREYGERVGPPHDDETDGTPLAHPAYWRGEAAGVWGVVSALTDILDGKPRGTFGDSRLEALAVRVEALTADAERWDRVRRLITIGEPDRDGYTPITFDDSPLLRAAYALWDSTMLGDRENCTNVARVVDEAVIAEKGDR